MGQATKGGMYCGRCRKPVAAVKTTHGVRNALAVPTLGLAGKVEDWHCPDCGGPVVRDRGGSEAGSLEREAMQEDALRREVWGASAVIVQPTEKTSRLEAALTSVGSAVTQEEARALIKEIKAGRPITVEPGVEQSWVKAFVRRLKELGCEYEVVRPEGSGPVPEEDVEAPDDAPALTAEGARRWTWGSEKAGSASRAGDDVLAKIETLGQLHEAGVLTYEEFQAKKAELLDRL